MMQTEIDAKAEIDAKVQELSESLQRLRDLAERQGVRLAAYSGRERQQGGLERRGAPSSSPHEALHAVGNALRAIGVAMEGTQGTAAASFEGSHGHTGTVPPSGQASAAAATSGDVVFNTSKPIWKTVGHTAPRADREEWKKILAALPSVEERARDLELDGRILRGCEVSEANLQQQKRVVRFLVSSTFTVSSPCVYACAPRVGLRCPPSALSGPYSRHACAQLPSVRPVWALLTARLRAAALRPPCLGPTHGKPGCPV
jgi:hypothetical protein